MSFPFRYLGHGTAKVSETFRVWLRFRRSLGEAERAGVVDSMPELLRDMARKSDTSTLEWDDRGLAVDSGDGFKYAIKAYDPDHLDWLDQRIGNITDADVQRVVAEVMNDDRSGPRSPKASDWDLFDAELDLWLAAVHQDHPLELVVKDVRVGKKHESKWHAWSVEECAAAAADLVEDLGVESAPHLGLIEPMVRYVLLARTAKSLTDSQRVQLIAALHGSGHVDAGALTTLVMAYPAKERLELVRSLIEAEHPGAFGVFLTPKGKPLLHEDALFETALDHIEGYEVPASHWLWEVTSRLKLEYEIGGPDLVLTDANREWLRRVMVLVGRSGSLDRPSRALESIVSWAEHLKIEWS